MFLTKTWANCTGSSGLLGAYVPSFVKKEVGSAGQRMQLAPILDPSPADSSSQYSSLKTIRPHIVRPSFNMSMKSTPGLLPAPPPVQPVHGRIDWSSKCAAHC
ncbi:serine/threonine-protein kinase ICK-like isoform X1 [Erythrolamprus reginae]|uniref:serine/threonine-protein kinase ICK-like isoform X1 n=1 Tax=Erythrolamprus reginae TaxID=121349 RepID=UPI00396CAEE6